MAEKVSSLQGYTSWEKDVVGLSRDKIKELQLERLQSTLNRAYTRVDFYRKRFDEIDFSPEDVTQLNDLQMLPFTTQKDLARHYPYGLFSVPLKDIVRLKFSTSLDNSPIVIGHTKKDRNTWAELMARFMAGVGVTERDIIQVAFNYSLFTGAFNFNSGAEYIGATVAPTATVSATVQLRIMQDFRSTVIATTPSFALHILKTMKKQSLDPYLFHLRTGIFGPESMSVTLRKKLEEGFGIKAYGIYGVHEMVEPGMGGECEQQDGFHLAEDHFFAEIINPATAQLLPPGTPGELVITTLTTEAYPLIRYRTGDITTIKDVPCACGRCTLRFSPIFRRSDDRVTVRGVSFYPQQVETLIREIEPNIPDFRLKVSTTFGLGDQLDIILALPEKETDMHARKVQVLERVRSSLRRNLGLGVRVQWIRFDQLPVAGLLYKTIIE